MNTQAGNRLRPRTAVRGNTETGSQPIHEEPWATSADSISFVLLSGNEITLLRRCGLRRRQGTGRHLCRGSCEPVAHLFSCRAAQFGATPRLCYRTASPLNRHRSRVTQNQRQTSAEARNRGCCAGLRFRGCSRARKGRPFQPASSPVTVWSLAQHRAGRTKASLAVPFSVFSPKILLCKF
jgi:hypothetical protein